MALIDLDTHILSDDLFYVAMGLVGVLGRDLEVITCKINSITLDTDSNFKDRFKAVINQQYTVHLNTLFTTGYQMERFELLIFDFSKVKDDAIYSFEDVSRFEKENVKPSLVAYFCGKESARKALKEVMSLYLPTSED